MKQQKLSRRAFLERAAALGAVSVVGGSLLTACSKKGPACDVSSLSADDEAKRAELQYADVSPESGKNCSNCAFYQAESGSECGQCNHPEMPGPVHPNGWCNVWVTNGQ